jgi:hypothetical protein
MAGTTVRTLAANLEGKIQMKEITTTESRFLMPCMPAWMALCALLSFGIARPAAATENGACVFPVGVETVMTGMQPPPRTSAGYEYTAFYSANELDNSKGKSSLPEFKLRVFATALKMTHNWGWRLFGGTVETELAVPLLYEQLHVPPGKFTKYSISNADLVPVAIAYNKGDLHWYYEADLFGPGAAYSSTDILNVGQHNLAIAPVAGFTYLPQKGETELSSRFTYVVNGPDSATGYHSGNEFFWEYNADHAFAHDRFSLGVNGAYYQQTTDDAVKGLVYESGYRGRDLQIGPQARFPLGKHGGFAFKYYRDTLIQNKPRGSALWFQIAIPLNLGHSG